MDHFTTFDIIVVFIVGISALLSFYRGFIRETLSLSGWLLSSYVALRFLEPASLALKPHIGSEPMAAGVAAIGLFFGTLIGCSLLSSAIIKTAKPGTKIGKIDNLAGLCFGIARGVLIVAIGFFILTKFFGGEKNYPEMVQDAATRPQIEEYSQWIADIAPNYLDKVVMQGKAEAAKAQREGGPGISTGFSNFIGSIEKKPNMALDKNYYNAPETQPSMQDLQQRIQQENQRR